MEELAQVEHVTSTESAVIREELQYDVEDLKSKVEARIPTFTPEQLDIFNCVMNAVGDDSSLQVVVDARGGCGKTYLLNTILAAVRSSKAGGRGIALAMGTTGIAANLLDLGRTFHSRMKAPLSVSEDSTLKITAQSELAKLIKRASLLLIDEATMLDRYMLEAMDRTLRDLMNAPLKPFGGKILILAGDFRQCLPVVPGASRAGTVKHCVSQSHLWREFRILKLSVNMRVNASGNVSLQEFDDWTLRIGNGLMDAVTIPKEMVATEIEPNSGYERFLHQDIPKHRNMD